MTLLFLLAYLGGLAEARLQGPWPDLILIFLLPMTLKAHPYFLFPAVIILGVLRDGLSPQIPWFSPLFFALAGLAGVVFRGYVNLKLLLPKLLFLLFLAILYEGLQVLVSGLNPGFLLTKAVLTTFFALLVTQLSLR